MARRPSEVSPAILRALHRGERETANLAEGLAIDERALAQHCLPRHAEQIGAAVSSAKGVVARTAAAGAVLVQRCDQRELIGLQGHASDVVRGWVAMAIGSLSDRPMDRQLKLLRRSADDPHFGVREWAWIGFRWRVIARLDEALRLLEPWTAERSDNLRRFASEATRPRGVWCAHVRALRDDPALGLLILEPMRDDASTYVQDSVSNWLNDASKDRAAFVRDVCDRWLVESPTPRTARICRRALRSLARSG